MVYGYQFIILFPQQVCLELAKKSKFIENDKRKAVKSCVKLLLLDKTLYQELNGKKTIFVQAFLWKPFDFLHSWAACQTYGLFSTHSCSSLRLGS